MPLGNNRTSVTLEQFCQSHLGIIVPVSRGNNRADLTWKQSWQSHLGTIVPVSQYQWRIQEWSDWCYLYCFQSFGQFKILNFKVQSPASSVQSPASRVQIPASKTCIQSPGIPVCPPKHVITMLVLVLYQFKMYVDVIRFNLFLFIFKQTKEPIWKSRHWHLGISIGIGISIFSLFFIYSPC